MKKLFKRTSTGKIQEWSMEIDGGKYRTISGQQEGKKVTSEWTAVEAKNVGRSNETSPAEQAKVEVKAKYVKQLREGYVKDIVDVDDSGFLSPMLAKNYEDRRKEVVFDGTWGLQTKFNGFRCKADKNGLFSRKGPRYMTDPHIERALKPFFDKYPNAVLDGELFNEKYRQQLNQISKLCQVEKPGVEIHFTAKDYAESEKIIRFYVYDGYNFTSRKETLGISTPYLARKEYIDEYVIGKYDYIEDVVTYTLTSQEKLDEIYGDRVEEGHEGVILRKLTAPYEHKRSKYLLKYKPVDDAEFEVVDIQEGTGNWAGTGKRIVLRMTDGKEFASSFKGTHEQATQFLKEKDQYIGKIATIYYNGLTGLGTPNFARFDINNWDKGH